MAHAVDPTHPHTLSLVPVAAGGAGGAHEWDVPLPSTVGAETTLGRSAVTRVMSAKCSRQQLSLRVLDLAGRIRVTALKGGLPGS